MLQNNEANYSLKIELSSISMSYFTRNRFYDTDVRDLIKKYKQYECLWNCNSPDYKNQALRQRAWQEIADFFKKDVNEAKRKIKHLRASYVAEKRKVDLSKKAGIESLYKPLLFYYEDLNFLENIIVLRKGTNDSSNLSIDFETTNISQDTEDNEEQIEVNQPKLNFKVEALAEPELELPLSPKTESLPQIADSASLQLRPVKRKINEELEHDNPLSGNVLSEHVRKLQCRNLYFSFGKTIALQLQQMPLEEAVLAMSEINSIITKKTIEHIKSLRNKDSCDSSDADDSFDETDEEEIGFQG